MNEVALYNRYNLLIDTVLKWKVIPLPCLMDVIKSTITPHSFRQNIRALEKGNLLKSSLYGVGREKILHPSSELISRQAPHLSSEVLKENLQHDALVTKLSLALLKYPLFKNVELPHEYKNKSKHYGSIYKDIVPDAVFWGEENGENIFVALEVELWRKERTRVFEKFLKYAKSDFFHFVFYFFVFESSFDSYKKRLKELIEEVRSGEDKRFLNEKIVLVHTDALLGKMTSLGSANVYVNETEKTFKELLGDEKMDF